MTFFIYESRDDELTTYKTKEEFEKALQDFDFIGGYCDDGWSEEVDNILAGYCQNLIGMNFKNIDTYDFLLQYTTHRPQKYNIIYRPDDIDDDEGYSESTETHWPDEWDYICQYAFEPVTKNKEESQ